MPFHAVDVSRTVLDTIGVLALHQQSSGGTLGWELKAGGVLRPIPLG
ncbi:MAG TPA: hypothetical protein VEK33_10570 [Terriglobales bacterium]|nr:hypothetical protein [Terriglobales bacterium]